MFIWYFLIILCLVVVSGGWLECDNVKVTASVMFLFNVLYRVDEVKDVKDVFVVLFVVDLVFELWLFLDVVVVYFFFIAYGFTIFAASSSLIICCIVGFRLLYIEVVMFCLFSVLSMSLIFFGLILVNFGMCLVSMLGLWNVLYVFRLARIFTNVRVIILW